MPLQKLQPQTSHTADTQSTKRQLQERRRTLQTISELSTVDLTSVRFVLPTSKDTSSAAPSKSREKRRSLPHYYSTPNSTSVHSVSSNQMRNSNSHAISTASSARYEAGWNARREQARIQTEQALANARLQSKTSAQKLRSASSAKCPAEAAPVYANESHHHIRLRASQQHLLQGSPSNTTLNSSSEGQSSFGSMSRYKEHRAHDIEHYSRPSTDSNALRSNRGSNPRRCRSNSSSGSISTYHPPPLPTGLILPTYQQPILAQRNGVQTLHHPFTFGMQNVALDRSWSLPVMNLDYSIPHYHEVPIQHYNQMSHNSQNRFQSGQARYGHQETAATPKKQDPECPVTYHERIHHSSRPSVDSRRSHSRTSMKTPSPPLQSPPPAYTANASSTILHDQDSEKTKQHLAAAVHYEKRPVPNRDNLTKWKTEREEANAEFNGIQRAKMKERVRRANELEFQKEKELRALGKGMANEKACRVLGKDVDEEMGFEKKTEVKKKSRGCFGGLFGTRK